ncbi:membrane protein insertase YidC [Stagnimonas aquatica]|uniref:Membrane protein insertase YidC n=1 Tax=Stagnimonas aquatica TaxID=2689987 RepID=A0A3N0VLT1_9GAMM|nr:membrane protein insertase YidC [Stagnimonas aquatica]ROH93705.1 membrane protein insertase YidC [Stagnimonas aquatica]
MESRRFFLIAIFGVLLFFTYQAWQKDHPAVAKTVPVASSEAPKLQEDPIQAGTAPAAVTAAAPGPVAEAGTAADAGRIKVSTDKLNVEISLAGGDLRRVELVGYPLSKAQPEINLALISEEDPHFFIVQSGLAAADKPLSSASTVFSSAASSYNLAPGADSLDVTLDAVNADGLKLRKVYRFHRGSYQLELLQTLGNGSAAPVQASPYARMQRTPTAAGPEAPFVHTFLGIGFYEQKEDGGYRFKKLDFKKIGKEPFEVTQTGGWLAMLQHYFIATIIPPADEKATYSGKPSTVKGFLGQYYGPMQTIAPGAEQTFQTGLYIGPKLQGKLDKVAPGLELTEDYGILTPIAKPLFWLLQKFHALFGNWGIAIILLTLTVKGVMYKLSEAQFRSMAKMKKFAPRITEIRERYAGDRERLNKAMMELYTKEGFNPLAGCWPILVQFPVFIALYWVLLESVELRQATLGLWLNDLSAPDPYYVLPVLFGLSMWLQQKLGGQMATMDPMQQRMMQFMPIALAAFFTFFPAGLVLYWFVSNVISIAQQWYITRKLDHETAAKAATQK